MLKALRAWASAVQSFVPPAAAPVATFAAERTETLRKIHAWLAAWTDVARTVVTRRDYLIRLGVAKRRSGKAKAKTVPSAPAVHDDSAPASRVA